MRTDEELYTFILNYAGGTYISQYADSSHTKAFERWLVAEPAKLEKPPGAKLARGLSREHEAVDGSLTPLDGLQNVWCWTALLPRGLALVNVVRTSRR
jgi:hypothetical protein